MFTMFISIVCGEVSEAIDDVYSKVVAVGLLDSGVVMYALIGHVLSGEHE